MDQDEFLNQLKQLRVEYMDGLDQRLSGIDQLLHQLGAEQDGARYDIDIQQELFRQIHSLSGSAATFGFNKISALARTMETAFHDDIKHKKKFTSAQLKQFEATTAQLKKLIDQGPDQAITQQLPVRKVIEEPDGKQLAHLYLIEDDEIVAREIQGQLLHMGFNVQHFSDATSACKTISNQRPDAMLVDVMLPEGMLGGPELADLINDIGDDEVPVIFISSRGDWQARLAAVRAGGQAYLTKPIDYMKLLNQLDRVILRSRSKPFRILVLDDTHELAQHYALVLRKAGMHVVTLKQPEHILKTIADFKPELVVLDLYMPEISGIEVAHVIRQHEKLLGLPIVFLSTEQDRDIQLRALQEGDDFLQKPISDHHLIAAITTRAERARTLSTMMYRDGLTGLLNHSSIKSRLQDEIQRARRHSSALCFVMIDLDHFKKINDRYGHPVGDRVLKGLSRLLIDRLRKSDQVGRYGGEEFAVILPDTEASNALQIMQQIRQHFAALWYTADETDFHCTFSAGIAQLNASDTVSTLNKRADEMLYRAKQKGRNKVMMSDD